MHVRVGDDQGRWDLLVQADRLHVYAFAWPFDSCSHMGSVLGAHGEVNPGADDAEVWHGKLRVWRL